RTRSTGTVDGHSRQSGKVSPGLSGPVDFRSHPPVHPLDRQIARLGVPLGEPLGSSASALAGLLTFAIDCSASLGVRKLCGKLVGSDNHLGMNLAEMLHLKFER